MHGDVRSDLALAQFADELHHVIGLVGAERYAMVAGAPVEHAERRLPFGRAGGVRQRRVHRKPIAGLGKVKELLSSDHFSVDGTLIDAWASMKSFRQKDGSGVAEFRQAAFWRKDANYCRSTNDEASDRILVLLQNLHLLRMRHGQQQPAASAGEDRSALKKRVQVDNTLAAATSFRSLDWEVA